MSRFTSVYIKHSKSPLKTYISFLFLLLGVMGIAFYTFLFSPNILVNKENCLIIIPKGSTLHQLVAQLKQKKSIKYSFSFIGTAYLLRYRTQNGAGQYRLMRNMSNWKAISLLRSRAQYPIRLTFSSAADKQSLVEQLTKETGVEKENLWTLLHDLKLLASYGFSPENVLTMFIPDSYEVYWTITAEQLLTKMYRAYKKFWNSQRLNKAAKIGLTPIEISVLASIVQAETNDLHEAAMIAGVYLNRLKQHMRIESCPALLFALKKGKNGSDGQPIRRLLQKDTNICSPYNTYRNRGLPPGPIALPTVAMIDAVLNYVQHNYLFFSAKEDFSGLHYFAHTFCEHRKNAHKYRRMLNKQKVMR